MSSDLRQRKPAAATSQPPQKHLHSHSHSHSHGHGHSHAHGEEEATALLSALQGSSDPGSRITLVGLGANVGLTVVKGVAGVLLGSAALLADAAHSGSDLLADIVTLTTYRMSRKPVSVSHPYGYGKYESLGSLVVSFLLLGTAVGIGLHSYHLLLETLSHNPDFNSALLKYLDVLPHGHDHGAHGGEGEGELTDARAMLFAGSAVLIKEYLYRITLKVAKAEHSNVLLANAFHHRSDAFGSLVAFGAIGGAWAGFPVLDPLGGLLVSGMILKGGVEVGLTALKELTDQVTDSSLPPQVYDVVAALLRIFASGPSFLVDVELVLPGDLTLNQCVEVEKKVEDKLRDVLGKRVREVVVRMRGEKEV
ncbi:protein of cation efflux protein family, iron transporter [Pseudohyphozyma bogoriensis]|nr:protein of cation efflux protein family, iron transporter [Pseudohyphozyma bogoriensis]